MLMHLTTYNRHFEAWNKFVCGTVNVSVSSYDAVERQNMSLRLELELTEKLNLELWLLWTYYDYDYGFILIVYIHIDKIVE